MPDLQQNNKVVARIVTKQEIFFFTLVETYAHNNCSQNRPRFFRPIQQYITRPQIPKLSVAKPKNKSAII